MTRDEKLEMLNTLLDGSVPSDEKLEAYLTLAGTEIIQWMYHLVGVPENAEVPAKYDVTQVYAVVAGFTHEGSEGQKAHNENGINRTFEYADMLDYIHQNVLAIVRVGAIS